MSPSRWLSLLLAWTLLLHSLAPALASPRPLRANTPTQSTAHALSENRTHHQYLVDTSQPYAEVIQERAWASNVSGTQVGIAQIYRYDIGLDRLHYFKYQMPINGPPSMTPVLSEWLLFDGLGSTRMLVGDSGSVVDEFGYNDAFGIPYRVTTSGRSVAGPGFFLNGQQWDGGSSWGGAGTIWSGSTAFNSGEGLYFNRARYYKPGVGRFIGEDPQLGDEYEPVTLHRYIYAGHDSVNYSDPSGENFDLGSMLTSMATWATLNPELASTAIVFLGSITAAVFGQSELADSIANSIPIGAFG
ncbi:RHS repeat-associated core domain-containing protein, partial [Armatimonas sp.]|uniref:RHS repeat-associated core domain-containing protein n=1 Tax=Armatimonas sp. TaxID=1872638 RepID=UPI0037510196